MLRFIAVRCVALAALALLGIGSTRAVAADDGWTTVRPVADIVDPDEIPDPNAKPRAHDEIQFPDAKPRAHDEIEAPDAKPRGHDELDLPDAKPRAHDEIPFPDAKPSSHDQIDY